MTAITRMAMLQCMLTDDYDSSFCFWISEKRSTQLNCFPFVKSVVCLGLVSIARQMPRPRHKQNDYKVEQSSFTLIALFDSKLVVVVVVFGLKPGFH